MSDAVPKSPIASARAVDEADPCAVLVLDASGRIVAANDSARHLWGAAKKSLVGFSAAALFVLEGGTVDPKDAESQWKALNRISLDRSAPLVTRPLAGSARDVSFRLERAFGGAGSYIATIQPRPPIR